MFFGMAAGARRHGVVDELDRIRGARILGQRRIVEIRARASPGRITTFSSTVPNRRVVRVDLRLGLGREPDHLRVAAALEIEDAAIAPAVLVVADQPAIRIARQRRLAGAGQAEEERGVAGLADVGRAVHREHALQRQQVVEDREDRLLVLAGVAGAGDDDFARRRDSPRSRRPSACRGARDRP